MKKVFAVRLAITMLLLGGCASPLLVEKYSPLPGQAGGTAEQLDQDTRDCEWQMEKALAEANNYAVHQNHKNRKVAVCMRSKGWDATFNTPCGKQFC
jgi:hypothetical protein